MSLWSGITLDVLKRGKESSRKNKQTNKCLYCSCIPFSVKLHLYTLYLSFSTCCCYRTGFLLYFSACIDGSWFLCGENDQQKPEHTFPKKVSGNDIYLSKHSPKIRMQKRVFSVSNSILKLSSENWTWVVTLVWIPTITANNKPQLWSRKGSEIEVDREAFPAVQPRCHLLSSLSVYCHCHYGQQLNVHWESTGHVLSFKASTTDV